MEHPETFGAEFLEEIEVPMYGGGVRRVAGPMIDWD